MRGKLFVVSGPSGAGKGTVCKRLLAKRQDVYFSVSCTTRGVRVGEADGVDYHYITEEQFLNMRDTGGLLECSHHAGAWYGTPRQAAIEKMEAGYNVLLEIENNGAQQVIEAHPGTISVFILPPSRDTLIRRLVYRGTENLEKLRGRILKVPSELIAAHGYTCLIRNDDVEEAASQLNLVFDGLFTGREENAALLDALEAQFDDLDSTMKALQSAYEAYESQKERYAILKEENAK